MSTPWMASRAARNAWFTRERILTLLLAGATLLSLYLCYLIAKPFIPPIAFAVALAVATARPFRWLTARVPNDTVAAAIGVVLVTILIIGPCALLGTYLVDRIAQSVDDFKAGRISSDWRGALERIPGVANALYWAETRLDLRGQLSRLGGVLAQQSSVLLAGSIHLMTQLVIMLFVLFFLFRDRERALRATAQLVPLEEEETQRVFDRVGQTIRATVNGALTIAAIQATLAGVMYTLLGIPAAALWAAFTFIGAIVPVFGTVIVWGPIAVYLLLAGDYVKAIILVVWGALAVGTIDNLLYPKLVGSQLRLPTVVTFFAILGGVSLFGPAGLILGPLAIAITIALLDVWWERTTDGQGAEQAVVEEYQSAPPSSAIQEESNEPEPARP